MQSLSFQGRRTFQAPDFEKQRINALAYQLRTAANLPSLQFETSMAQATEMAYTVAEEVRRIAGTTTAEKLFSVLDEYGKTLDAWHQKALEILLKAARADGREKFKQEATNYGSTHAYKDYPADIAKDFFQKKQSKLVQDAIHVLTHPTDTKHSPEALLAVLDITHYYAYLNGHSDDALFSLSCRILEKNPKLEDLIDELGRKTRLQACTEGKDRLIPRLDNKKTYVELYGLLDQKPYVPLLAYA